MQTLKLQTIKSTSLITAWRLTRQRAMLYLTSSLLLVLSACASVSPNDYRNAGPELQLDQYFNGTVDAWGMFQDRKGKVVRRFTVVLTGTWQGNQGVLEEDFVYDDGEKQRRVWTITKGENGQYTGTAADVVGTAQGSAAGNTLNWQYTLVLPVGDKTYEVRLDDWMYLINDQVMINRAQMSKFGFKLGEVLITFKKRQDRS